MLGALARKFFGSANDRRIKGYQSRVDAINALEPEIAALSDEALKARTIEFRKQLAEEGKTLDDLLVPAFATVREAAKRTLGQRHFDVQLIGGMVLHEGDIAEMKTGEGKTLVATLAVYLNALAGKGVHVVTVNDYLAKRDSEWMGQVYGFLGMTTGVIVHGLDDAERQTAYAKDITYGTNNEYGFDYLRDNMKYRLEDMVQRGHSYAIVDEVDSILIDEARTPLIISGPLDDRSEFYNTIDTYLPKLEKATDFEVDEKQRTVTLTEAGMEKIENLLQEAGQLKGDSLYDVENVSVVHHINQALRAHSLFQRDKDYIVRDGEVIIIDEFTGRMMPGRRYSEGLHQALEAKEHQPVQPENQTLASITFQNYFRMYDKLAGMTGTAATEEKHRAILAEIECANARMQPVLVGTASIEKSEVLGEYLAKNGYKQIDFNNPKAMEKLYAAARAGKPAKLFAVLNARFHEQEAYIVAEAGVPGAITIATNMAGRGTDIKLGGSLEMRAAAATAGIKDEAEKQKIIDGIKSDIEKFRDIVLKAEETFDLNPDKPGTKTIQKPGGLYIIGSERHESRRIDNQLRGRAGRQGDPGRTKFYLSLEDDLMRIFGSDRLDTMLTRLGLKEGEAIIHPWINKALEKAQQKVEARNFDIRKNLLKFDDVQNDQRKAIFDQRIDFMRDQEVAETVADMRHTLVEDLVSKHVPEHAYAEQWDVAGLHEELKRVLDLDLHRQRGDAVAHRAARGRADGGEVGAVRPRGHALCREVDPAADAGSSVARASGNAGSPASGHRPARLWSARSAAGIQNRGVQSVREPDRSPAGSGNRTTGAGRNRAAGRAARIAADGSAQAQSEHGRRRDGVRAGVAGAGGGLGTRSEQSRDMGQDRPQRGLSVRLRQEVQALPRQIRLSGAAR